MIEFVLDEQDKQKLGALKQQAQKRKAELLEKQKNIPVDLWAFRPPVTNHSQLEKMPRRSPLFKSTK
ncbi:hypothetical protein BH10CYA1_BH10CYA1_40610 [soil metagenome]